ncbi:MAG TPA: hypothetical protein VGV38_18135 [Pyrinomonadaceae bacterium]|nr:hypothetical protein [Pyrinomonadaceae bacterium]
MKLILALIALALIPSRTAPAQQKPAVPEADRVRIAEAFSMAESLGERVWEGWDKAPFALLLVTPEHEFLIRHPRPSADFAPLGRDPVLRGDVYFRKRQFGTNLLATFPAVGGVPTVVIGQAENTSKKTSTPWVVTVLHEHFHQLQNSQPTYYADVNALNLSRGDQTGMWMLNYAFPYSSPEVSRHFNAMSRALAEALRARNRAELSAKVAAYLEARKEFARLLSPDDYKYFSFQVWQEGVARYTEYRVAELAAKSYRPSRAFRALKDYKPFKTVADEIRAGILNELTTLRLEGEHYRRVAFYPFGAGEALLLDRINPGWKSRYLTDKFYVDRYFDSARRRRTRP